MAEFTPITTQEAFDEAIKSRLERERASVRKEYADYDSLKENLAKKTREAEDLTGSVNDLKAQVETLSKKVSANETASAKTRIAYQMGLPYEMSVRLVGNTEDEIRKDAEALQKICVGARRAPMFSPENSGNAKDEALRKMLGDMKN